MTAPADPNAFRGNSEAFLAWAAEHWQQGPQWCPKHWMPCPVEGRNGINATMLLMPAMLESIPQDVRDCGPSAMNSWMANTLQPVCCRLGDEAIARIWAEC